MGIVDLLLIAFGLAMDAFAVSVTNGMSMFKLRLKQAFAIAFAFGLFQGIMPAIGYFLGHGFENYINTFGHWIALILPFVIGGKMMYEGIKNKGEEENNIKILSIKLLTIQAVATSIDALMIGVTFVAMGVSLLFSVIIISIVTFIISFAGVYIGKKFGDILKSKSEIFGGVILILIGIKIFLENI